MLKKELERKYNELKDFYEAKTIYVQSLQAENEMNNRVIEKLLTENRELKLEREGLRTTVAILRKSHKEFCNDVGEKLTSKTKTIMRQQEQIEDLKDTVNQLLDMIDELRETGEINW